MVVVGSAFIILGLAEITRAWLVESKTPTDLEISVSLIGVGIILMWFGTPDEPEAIRVARSIQMTAAPTNEKSPEQPTEQEKA